MITTKKELFNFYAGQGIFLPQYHLDQVYDDVISRIRKGESIFKIMYELESSREYSSYNEPAKGAFSLAQERDATKKGIISIDKNGNETRYESLYAAAIALGKGKNGAGNISKAAKGRYKTIYGYSWRLDK